MQVLKKESMQKIIGGGVSMSGAIVSAIKGYINAVFAIGQAVGGAIRRISSGNLCKF